MGFREVPIESIEFNPFAKIGKQWMLVTAGDQEKFNTMTASWGAAGVMWGKKAVTVYIRPQRYTKEFIDTKDTFTLSFYKEEFRKQCHLDKIKKEYKDKGTAFSKCHLEELKTIRSYKLMEKGKNCMTKKQVYICF